RAVRGRPAGAGVHRAHRSLERRTRDGERVMKAGVDQQRLLLELAEIDAELARIDHRTKNLPARAELEAQQRRHQEATDRLAVLGIAVEDIDAEAAKLESEIEAVRRREERDRAMLEGGGVNAKQLTELQHELQTLERRKS